MAYQSDYLLRQIEDIGRFIGMVLMHRAEQSVREFDEQGNALASGILYRRLLDMLAEKCVNEAENELFAALENDVSDDMLRMALQFYTDLSMWSDAKLREADFSRAEIADGLKDLQEIVCAPPKG